MQARGRIETARWSGVDGAVETIAWSMGLDFEKKVIPMFLRKRILYKVTGSEAELNKFVKKVRQLFDHIESENDRILEIIKKEQEKTA